MRSAPARTALAGAVVLAALSACALTPRGSATANEESVNLDVPFVPTPQPVVDKMLELAAVTKDDLVYDLGSGDGRIVVTAAKRYGARGVGIDIDPARVAEGKRNAEAAGVSGRTRFVQQDLFETDFSEATVVTMYLLSSVNQQLRPRLLEQLRPGTRVVSHSFDMGDWEPDQVVEVRESSGSGTVYYWVVPAQVAGSWDVTLPAGAGPRNARLEIEQKYQEVTGTATIEGRRVPLEAISLVGDRISFTLRDTSGPRPIDLALEGKVEGSQITGLPSGSASSPAAASRSGSASGPGGTSGSAQGAASGAATWSAKRVSG